MTQPAFDFSARVARLDSGHGSLPADERTRLKASALRVLAYLRSHPAGATNVELCRPEIGGLRSAGRVWELQRAGYAIAKAHVHGGIWRYRLVTR